MGFFFVLLPPVIKINLTFSRQKTKQYKNWNCLPLGYFILNKYLKNHFIMEDNTK